MIVEYLLMSYVKKTKLWRGEIRPQGCGKTNGHKLRTRIIDCDDFSFSSFQTDLLCYPTNGPTGFPSRSSRASTINLGNTSKVAGSSNDENTVSVLHP